MKPSASPGPVEATRARPQSRMASWPTIGVPPLLSALDVDGGWTTTAVIDR